MRRRLTGWCLVFALLPSLAWPESSPGSPWPWRYNYVAFEVEGLSEPLGGRLSFPYAPPEKMPAVVIAHGSGGVDSRGPLYARRLNEAGIATLEIDMWTARRMSGGLDRPAHVRETLPDASAARAYLASRDDIDPDRIGLMGFSWGGVMAMLSAADTADDMTGYTALAALYPVCWGYNRVPGYELEKLMVNDLLVIAGTQDDYDGRNDCDNLLASLSPGDRKKAELLTLKDATHAFDRRAPESRFNDPFAFRGKGGEVSIRYNPAATKHALSRVTDFFTSTLSPKEGGHQPNRPIKPGQMREGTLDLAQ